MRIKDGGPAFPSGLGYKRDEEGNIYPNEQDGMTLRDYFAGKAMQEIMSESGEVQPYTIEQLAQWAYQVADAMLKAREQQ